MHQFSPACTFPHQNTMPGDASLTFMFTVPAAAVRPCARDNDYSPAFLRASHQSWHCIVDKFIRRLEPQTIDHCSRGFVFGCPIEPCHTETCSRYIFFF